MSDPTIRSLSEVTLSEACAYLAAAHDDELAAALRVAEDRLRLAGSTGVPDDLEVHHALFLLRRARGLRAPSFDWMRVELRRKLGKLAA